MDHSDPRGDVVNLAGDNDEDLPEGPIPRQTNGDVTRILLRHKETRIRIRATFADLRRVRDPKVNTELHTILTVATNEGVRRQLTFSTGSDNNWTEEWFIERPAEGFVRCALHHSVDYVNNVIVVGSPRTCISRPRWVQMRFVALMPIATSGNGVTTHVICKDDALRNGLRAQDPYGSQLSPRIYRGSIKPPARHPGAGFGLPAEVRDGHDACENANLQG